MANWGTYADIIVTLAKCGVGLSELTKGERSPSGTEKGEGQASKLWHVHVTAENDSGALLLKPREVVFQASGDPGTVEYLP